MLAKSVAVAPNFYWSSLVLHWPASLNLVDEQFFDFCQANRELCIERTAQGDLEIMAPTGGVTSWRNSNLITQLQIWAEREGSGVVFDSSAGFLLANGAIRSPDVSWVEKHRLATLTLEEKQRFLSLCPDFLIELRSPSDNIVALQDKMQEYLANGVRLGWLIDPERKQIFLYQPPSALSRLDNPKYLSGEPVLRGFSLDLTTIWNVGF